MPYTVYLHTKSCRRYVAIPDGTDVWLTPVTDVTVAGELHTSTGDGWCPVGYSSTGTTLSDADLRDVTVGRVLKARELYANHFRATSYVPRTPEQVTIILEGEFLTEYTRIVQDATALNTALRRLFDFTKRRLKSDATKTYAYSLEDGFVGETAHIHGAKVLNPHKTVTYHCTTSPPSGRFSQFMTPVTAAASGADAKTRINETLIAPRTVADPTSAHETVLTSFVAGITAARRQEIAQWVGGQFAPHAAGAAVKRVGIWVRNVAATGGHTVDQNMSKERFQKILEAAHQSGADDVILLGDALPHDNWLNYPTGGAHYARHPGMGQGTAYDFTRLWLGTGPLPAGAHSAPATLRGYAEQVAVYTALYRNPSAIIHANMSCIVTNKSGGPDLPSLAGVPQIQVAEMDPTEKIIFHRMGFQALCSHAWTVVRSAARGHGEPMTLSGPQVTELADLLRRAEHLRRWHLDKLKSKRFGWML